MSNSFLHRQLAKCDIIGEVDHYPSNHMQHRIWNLLKSQASEGRPPYHLHHTCSCLQMQSLSAMALSCLMMLTITHMK